MLLAQLLILADTTKSRMYYSRINIARNESFFVINH